MHHYYWQGIYLMTRDPVQSYLAMRTAMDWMDWDWRMRIDYASVVKNLMSSDKPALLTHRAADVIHGIGMSASPHFPQLLMHRVEYLYSAGKMQTPEAIALIEELAAAPELRARQFVENVNARLTMDLMP